MHTYFNNTKNFGLIIFKNKTVSRLTAFLFLFVSLFGRKQGEKLAQAPAWAIRSAGQCGQNRRCFQGDPVLCFFGGKGVIVKTFLLRGLQKLVFQNIL